MKLAGLVAIVALAAGCKEAKPALDMSSNSAACKKAMACCEERVKADTGKLTADDLNLMCSGVALATTDAQCDEFRIGYASSFESKNAAVPAACK